MKIAPRRRGVLVARNQRTDVPAIECPAGVRIGTSSAIVPAYGPRPRFSSLAMPVELHDPMGCQMRLIERLRLVFLAKHANLFPQVTIQVKAWGR